jgi:HK97 family phage prohead protease
MEGLRREAPFSLRTAAEDGEAGDGLTLDGYAAVFNRETIINSWEGRFKERIAPGAMKKSFRENPPKIQFDHGHHPLIGSIPIASVRSIVEDVDPVLAPEGGAHIVARLFDNWLVQPVRDAIADEAIDGMSFRFGVVREEWRDHEGKRITDEVELRELLRRTWYEEVPDEELLVRTLKELKVPELGPVVWPAYAETSVGVRSQTLTINLARLSDPEQRAQLARAVILADRAEGDDSPQPTEPTDVETDVAPEPAEEHEVTPDDTPQATDEPSAGEHESAPTRTADNRLKGEILARLRQVRHSLIDAEAASERVI